jgi:ferric-dicitrate binding protein FerR (iron transport regulator)
MTNWAADIIRYEEATIRLCDQTIADFTVMRDQAIERIRQLQDEMK